MIPLDLSEGGPKEIAKTTFRKLRSFDREFAKTNLWACYMAIFSSFLTDLACLYTPLIAYTDHSLVDGFLLFVKTQDNRVSAFYYCDVVYVLVFYTGTLVSLLWENVVAWDMLRNWVNVGILLSLLSLPFNG